ncbi:hypothetical protein KP79_PYT24175 [Mizuhopecten yessoensis]|uniref:Uncharacterized protein n=1 Tax=Mizuhopecten yessoensis TaxID=6573 RepID=A0A210Q3V9_MIZYE|nr:hypothetical protein KP79_PYT24175 [Mizuhopecten yessoensis]
MMTQMSVALDTDQTSATQTDPDTIDKCVGPDQPMDVYSTGCQTTYSLVQRRHVSLQVQVNNGKSKSCGVQATCSTNTSSTQCQKPIREKTPTKMNDMET